METRLKEIHQKINKACERVGRNPSEVKLLLATKTVEAERILEALKLGENLIGENRVQEFSKKIPALKEHNPEVHFIGHLQTNKIKEVLKWVTCIQSIDRIDLAERLNRRLEFEKKQMDVFIQVNTSYEDSKFGVLPEKAIELTKQVAELENLHVKGLMTIGLFSVDGERVRKCYRTLREIQQEIKALNIPNVSMDELSMGMSGSYEIAVEEGATIVRIGTTIFGERIYPDSYYWNEEKS